MSEQKLRIRMGRQGQEKSPTTEEQVNRPGYSRVIGTLAVEGTNGQGDGEMPPGLRSTVHLRPEATPNEHRKMSVGEMVERVYPDGSRRSFMVKDVIGDRLTLQEVKEDGSPGVITSIKSSLVGSGLDAEGRSWKVPLDTNEE